jgi:peroxiredoxin
MNKIAKSLVVMLTLIVMLSGISSADIKIGEPAPDFTLMDSDEKPRSLSEFQGKHIVLEWFNPQCPFVRKHYDSGNMQGLQEKYTTQNVVWLSINSSAEGKQGYLLPEDARKFIEDNNVHSTAVLLDPQGTVGKLYGAQTTPHMFIIDPEGAVIYQGAIDDIPSIDTADIAKAKNYVDEILSLALSGQPVSTSSTKSYGCSVKY